jgi:hypothetical protein
MLLQRLCLSVALLSSFPLMAQSSSAPTASAGAESLADQWSKASAKYDRRRTIPLIHMQGARQLRSDDRDVAAVKIIDHHDDEQHRDKKTSMARCLGHDSATLSRDVQSHLLSLATKLDHKWGPQVSKARPGPPTYVYFAGGGIPGA